MDKQYVKNQSVPMPFLLRFAFIWDFLMCLFYLVVIIMLAFDKFIGESPAIEFFRESGREMIFVYIMLFLGITANAGLMRGFPRTLPLGYLNWLAILAFTVGYFVGYRDFWMKLPDVVPAFNYVLESAPWQIITVRSGFIMLYLMALMHVRMSFMVNFKHQEGLAAQEASKETMGGMGQLGRLHYLQEHGDQVEIAAKQASAVEQSEATQVTSNSSFFKIMFVILGVIGLSFAILYFVFPDKWQQMADVARKQILERRNNDNPPLSFSPNWNNPQPTNLPNTPNPPTPSNPPSKPPILKPNFPSDTKVQAYEKALSQSIQIPDMKNPTIGNLVLEICRQTKVPMLKNPQFIDKPIKLQLAGKIQPNQLLSVLLHAHHLDYVVSPRGLYIISGQDSKIEWQKLEIIK